MTEVSLSYIYLLHFFHHFWEINTVSSHGFQQLKSILISFLVVLFSQTMMTKVPPLSLFLVYTHDTQIKHTQHTLILYCSSSFHWVLLSLWGCLTSEIGLVSPPIGHRAPEYILAKRRKIIFSELIQLPLLGSYCRVVSGALSLQMPSLVHFSRW